MCYMREIGSMVINVEKENKSMNTALNIGVSGKIIKEMDLEDLNSRMEIIMKDISKKE